MPLKDVVRRCFSPSALVCIRTTPAAVEAMVPTVRRFEPVPSAATTYATVRARWRSVRDIMRPLDALD